MRRRSKNTLMNWLKMGALVVVGAMFSGQVLEFITKIPVVGDMVNKQKES